MPPTHHQRRISDVLHRIHSDIDQPLDARELAKAANWSSFHFHRCFKAVTGENVNDYVRRTRLEMAANQLIFLTDESIIQIAQQCGFQSAASFTHAFKKQFGCTPSRWRASGYQSQQQENISHWSDDLKERMQAIAQQPLPLVRVEPIPPRHVVYLRHQGYGRHIRQAWEKLHAWADRQGFDWASLPQLGLHHSNADIIPMSDCRYVACVEVTAKPHQVVPLNQMVIPGGTYACFEAKGVYGDLLPLLHRFYHEWLPQSGYSLGATPGYADYRRCQFTDAEGVFDLTFCVPLRF
jgi:AraC family transcriptional regulator